MSGYNVECIATIVPACEAGRVHFVMSIESHEADTGRQWPFAARKYPNLHADFPLNVLAPLWKRLITKMGKEGYTATHVPNFGQPPPTIGFTRWLGISKAGMMLFEELLVKVDQELVALGKKELHAAGGKVHDSTL